MAEPILDIRGISKAIRGRTIVHPLSLQLGPGQVLALLGGNGAGKSTILRMVAGITQPTAGAIRVMGFEWRQNRKAFARHIGYMPDDFQFGASLTAKEMLLFYAALRGVGPERVNEVLAMVGLAEVQDKKVSTFSKGMRQRLMFAQAILSDPPLLVLDEPTNGLDAYWTAELQNWITARKTAGNAVILSTHDLEMAASVCDQAVFLQEGRMVTSGPASQIRDIRDSIAKQATLNR